MVAGTNGVRCACVEKVACNNVEIHIDPVATPKKYGQTCSRDFKEDVAAWLRGLFERACVRISAMGSGDPRIENGRLR